MNKFVSEQDGNYVQTGQKPASGESLLKTTYLGLFLWSSWAYSAP